MKRVDWIALIILLVCTEIILLIGINRPEHLIFDERFYVPAAREFLVHGIYDNWTHPPLGKMLIALGMALFKDTPLGWRFVGTLAGTATIGAVYYWSKLLFQHSRTALLVSLATVFNQLVFVESRIAMLDVYMFAFCVWGIALVMRAAFGSGDGRKSAWLGGAMLGLSLAAKWTALPGVALALATIALSKSQNRAALLAQTIGCTILAYFAVFAVCIGMREPPTAMARLGHPATATTPTANIKPAEIIQIQEKMLQAHLEFPAPTLPYQSSWWSWPLPLRGAWYDMRPAVALEGPEKTAGVLLLGNPAVMWGGFLALLTCMVLGWKRRSRSALIIVAAYLIFLLSWITFPRNSSFYYYYYPAGTLLSLALGWILDEALLRWKKWATIAGWSYVTLAAGLFIYFYPVLSGISLTAKSMHSRMWLPSWTSKLE